MAHPLTQHPPSALPFGAASRPSPLNFGFGFPSSAPSASSSTSTNPQPMMSGNAFAPPSPIGVPTHPPTFPFGKSPLRPSALNINAVPPAGPQFSLKRSRKSPSPSPSSSPSPSNSVLPSPRSYRRLSLKGKEREDLLRVGSLDLGDEDRVIASSRRGTKRIRQDPVEAKSQRANESIDIGILLSTLPPNSHLQILLSLLKDDPSLASSVLAKLPEPDLSDCTREIHKSLENVKKAYGNPFKLSSGTTDQLRAWNRAQDDLQAFCRMATTYLEFFHVPPAAPPHPHSSTTQALLLALTKSIISLLPLVPSDVPIGPSANHPLLNLAKALIEHWTVWLATLSEDVNKRGEMYPHSIVSQWMDALDSLVANTSPNHIASSWDLSADSARHPLMIAFNEALVPLRNRFVEQLGWMIGRRMMMA